MLNLRKYFYFFLIITILICSSFVVQAADKEKQKKVDIPIYNVTDMSSYLKNLPKPINKIAVAVYGINDRTGQYLQKDNGTSNSTAISQGATDMLIGSLVKSGQFVVADRSILNPFMTEQDLKRKKYQSFNSNEPFKLDKLIESRYIITGSITEYGIIDTGGTRVKINGKGLNGENAIAYAALDLRVVDSETNEVVYTVSLKDGITGEKKGLDILSFFGGDILVDLESGVGYQEPINLVVRRLIDAAVYDMSVNFFADKTGIKELLDSQEVNEINKSFSEKALVSKSEKHKSNNLLILLIGAALGSALN